MFYLLHRGVKWFFRLCVIACVCWLYTQRGVLKPVWAWYDVYQNGGLELTSPLQKIEGEGVTVLTGHSFQMKSAGKVYIVTLTGFDIPTDYPSAASISQEKERRELLRDSVVAKPVQVEITFANGNSLLGIVHASGTNLNLQFVRSGLSTFKPEYVKSAPRDVQFQFFATARTVAEKRLASQ